MAQGPTRDVDTIVFKIHDAFFGEHYVGQQELYDAIQNGVKEAMILAYDWSFLRHVCTDNGEYGQPDICRKCAFLRIKGK